MVGASKRRFNRYTTGTAILQNHNIIPAFRRNKNIQDLLVRAKIKPLTNLTSRRQGDHFKHIYWFTSHTTKEVFQNLTVGKLSSKIFVYLVTCKQCGLQYVGETGNTISTRFAQHKYNVSKKKKTDTICEAFYCAWMGIGDNGDSVQLWVEHPPEEEGGESLDSQAQHKAAQRP